MAKYRKKPVEIEAVQLRRDNWDDMNEFLDIGLLTEEEVEFCWFDPVDEVTTTDPIVNGEIALQVLTLEGVMLARENDWIIRGVQGELYPCKPDIFEQTYEEVK